VLNLDSSIPNRVNPVLLERSRVHHGNHQERDDPFKLLVNVNVREK
jgi:hypothetical protein